MNTQALPAPVTHALSIALVTVGQALGFGAISNGTTQLVISIGSIVLASVIEVANAIRAHAGRPIIPIAAVGPEPAKTPAAGPTAVPPPA